MAFEFWFFIFPWVKLKNDVGPAPPTLLFICTWKKSDEKNGSITGTACDANKIFEDSPHVYASVLYTK